MAVQLGNRDSHILPVGIDRHIYQIVRSGMGVVPREADGQGFGVFGNIRLICVDAVGVEGFHAADGIRQQLAYDRMHMPVPNHKFEKFKQFPVLIKETPVQPGGFVVLAIRVVVAVLGIAEFIPRQEHGRSAAAHQHGTGIADHPETEAEDFGVVGISFGAAVPAPVVVGAVRIVPAVFFVVFLVVGIEIVQCKAVMAGKEIHTGIIPGVIIVVIGIKTAVQVAGAGNAPGSVPGMPEVSL